MRPLITQDKLEKLIAKFIEKMDKVVAPAIATAEPYRRSHDTGRTFSHPAPVFVDRDR